jgi:hypothetical protein
VPRLIELNLSLKSDFTLSKAVNRFETSYWNLGDKPSSSLVIFVVFVAFTYTVVVTFVEFVVFTYTEFVKFVTFVAY